MTTNNTPAHWRTEIERLEGQLTKAEQALEDAKGRAATAILEGGDDESREIALCRDRIDATKAALGEAQRRLQAAEQAVTDKARKAALQRANDAARERHVAALDFDAALGAAEQAYTRFQAANMQWRKHQLDAGQKPFSTEKLNAGEAIRGAVTAGAYTLSGTLNARPHSRESRLPLASFVSQQTPATPGNRATKRKTKDAVDG